MGLMDRDYMYESYEDKMARHRKYQYINEQQKKLNSILHKKHLNIIDKYRIKKIQANIAKAMEL